MEIRVSFKIEKTKYVLDNQGYINLEDWYGDDLTIANAARQSFARKNTKLDRHDKNLINMLMRDRHGTPFEMVDFRFNVKAPLFVAREWFRHRIASYNEMSGRYKEIPEEWYVPPIDCIRSQVGKPGAYTFEPLDKDVAEGVHYTIDDSCKNSFNLYKELLAEGVAKEIARSVLPQAMMTQFTFKVNLRSLFNFISLRSHPTAMLEIREYSQAIEEMVAEIVPVAYNAFNQHNRRQP